MDGYNSKLASRIAGVSLRQIQYWDERGFVRPSVKLARGRGTRRLYSFRDLVCLKVAKDLTRHGLSLQKIRRCLRSLKDYGAATGEAADSLRYLTDGERLFVITSDRDKILRAMEREFVLSLRIGHLVRQLDGEVQRVAPRAGRKASPARRGAEARRPGSA
ncbi:MAG TPA: MerR family transcriptional regulator [Candidatus Eisenbacteria bacterium]|nr:MerR family transcriptional regulator [Candidatus Eisenbacteria bacterium]